jgi:ABC-type uncharacterized transport system permease subunit
VSDELLGGSGDRAPLAGPEQREPGVRTRSPGGAVGLADRLSGVEARRRRALVAGFLVLVLLAFVRQVTNVNDLTSPGTFGAALALGVPILLAGLGGLYSERAGIVNIGLEGMMILGTWFGAWAGWKYGPWWGVVLGTLGGGLGGLLHAVATVTFGIDQVISGVAINILAAGLARFLSVVAFPLGSGGSATQSPNVPGDIPTATLPILAGGKVFGWHSPDLFGGLASKHWFLVSDAAGALKGVTADISWITVIAVLLVPITFFVLWRTTFGLRVRSVGEHPMAAESLGVPVYTMKYVAVVLSGCLAGLGGVALVLGSASAGIYREGQTAGRGFIGLAALIFGNWRPGGVGAAATLFGYASALQLRSHDAVHALLLFVGIVVGLLVLWRAVRRRGGWSSGVIAGVAVGALVWYFASDSIPQQFVPFTPHLTTLIVLSLASQRLRPPAADGRPYRKGQAT